MKLCYTGPANLHTERWVTYFARHGHEVHLVIDEPVDYEGVVVHALHLEKKKRPGYFLKKLARLKKILREIQPDLLHTHYITGEGYISALTGFHPYVVTIWGNDIYLRPHEGFEERLFTRFVLRRADLITADSQDQIDAAIRLGAERTKGRVVQWGVDLNAFRPGAPSDVRARLGIGDAPAIISQRKFTPLYNIDLIIQAFADLRSALPGAHLIMTGSGWDEPELRAMTERLGLARCVHFTGYVEYTDLPKYLAASDVAVSVPSSDGTAMAILEAMACGVPLIVSDLPSNREWIEDGVNGFIVPVRNKEALTRRLLDMLQQPHLRKKFGETNVRIVRERADHDAHMRNMETYYYDLVNRYASKAVPESP